MKGDLEFFAPWLASASPNPKGEYRLHCPIHGDKNASASINFTLGVFHCSKPGCVGGGTIAQLKRMIREREGTVGKAAYNPFGSSKPETPVIDLAAARAKRANEAIDDSVKALSETLVLNYHNNLMQSSELLETFMQRRGLTRATIERFKLGYETKTKRYVIPVRDENGVVVNLRKYKLDADKSQKMINHATKDGKTYGSPPRLYPFENMKADTVYIVEGELDALIATQHGFPAVSGTGGAGRWTVEWGRLFADKDVVVIYDNDREGRLGAHKVKLNVGRHAKRIRVLQEVVTKAKGDITDYFVDGGTADDLRNRIAALTDEEAAEEEEAQEAEVAVIGSMDSSTNGKALRMTATVTGRRDPTRSIPREFEATCTLDYGQKCKTCPMLVMYEGSLEGKIEHTDLRDISRFIESGADDHTLVMKKKLGLPLRCDKFELEVVKPYTVEELYVTGNVDARNGDAVDYTQRRIYNVGDSYRTQTNSVAIIVGSTYPSPKTSKNEFYAWDLHSAVTSLDSFEVTPDVIKRLNKFKPTGKQRPIQKCREIALDMSHNVTGILGRERMHMGMDLVWHSPLEFFWRGKLIRGWVEMVVVGDTRTGKSETARSLARHYGLGHVVSCESASFAGLIGGATQIADQWTIKWGEYTINDRRLVVMDEISGLSPEIISLMSDVRSSGEAQLNKIEGGRTTARVRSIWISNPRANKYVDEKKTLGIDLIQDVIGNPEDIARFDIAMSVREEDVSRETIHTLFERGEPKYSANDCRDLLLWCWSRKPNDVYFKDNATKQVMENASKLTEMYVVKPGLIQMGNAHEKVARLSAALAARVFSTDDTATKVIVEREHVMDATNFLHRLYSYDNFGYYARSQRALHNRAIAQDKRQFIARWLRENRRVLEFLIDRHASFRSQDLEEMAHLDRDEAKNALNVLSDAKMISKDKSQIILEPELQDLLMKEFKRR